MACSIKGTVAWYLSVNRGTLFARQQDLIPGGKGDGVYVDIAVDADARFQEIDGFGASFTDSAAWLINQKLSADAKDALLEKLFHPRKGIGLSFIRQPMGASDFARKIYSFDDMPAGAEDFDLAHFSIDPDRENAIPLLKKARQLNPELRIMASPWSPPGWMKTSGSMIGGSLRPDCYDVYAGYFVRYIQAYEAEGIPLYAVTPQNEPLYVPGHYPGSGMDAVSQAVFIERSLGPAFRRAGITAKILCYDHNWDVTDYAETVLSGGAAQYVAGTAWHWYGGDPSAQSAVRDRFPHSEVYFTEGSGGEWIPPFTDAFMTIIVRGIQVLTHYGRSFVLWNMALDENNGPVVPGFGRSTCRGLVTVNQQTGDLAYNLDYDALAHFSRFIRPGARRVFAETKDKVYAAACRNRDGTLVIVAANNNRETKPVRFTVHGACFTVDFPGKSAGTWVMRLEEKCDEQ